MEGGAVHYLIKPFEYEDLTAQLQRFQDQAETLNQTTTAGQEDINKIFGYTAGSLTEAVHTLPKGLSAETAALVAELLESGRETSASDCADTLGISPSASGATSNTSSRPAAPKCASNMAGQDAQNENTGANENQPTLTCLPRDFARSSSFA